MGLSHNEGTIVRPRGRPATSFSVVPDLLLGDVDLSLSARLVLAYLVGRPPHWTAAVSDIRRALGIPETTWRRLRDELRAAGIVPRDHPRRFGGGSSPFTWVLDVDLSRYFLPQAIAVEFSTELPAKSADGSHPPLSIDGKRRITSTNSTLERPPLPARAHARAPVLAVGRGGEEIPDGQNSQQPEHPAFQEVLAQGLRGGLTPGEAKRVVEAAQSAEDTQLAILARLLGNPRPTVRDLAAWAVGLAQRAARGELTPPRCPAETSAPVQVWKPEPIMPASPEVQAAARARLTELRGQFKR